MLNNDKKFENINSKLESLSATVQNKLRFNKTLEKQIAQLAVAIPVSDSKKTLGKPEVQFESVNMVSMNYDKHKCQRRQGYFVDPPFITKMGGPSRLRSHVLSDRMSARTPSATLEPASM
jgi:hypothetical protein